MNRLLEWSISGPGEEIGLFFMPPFSDHEKDFSDQETLGVETGRMERIGQRSFQVEEMAVMLLSRKAKQTVVRMSLGHESLADGELLVFRKSM